MEQEARGDLGGQRLDQWSGGGIRAACQRVVLLVVWKVNDKDWVGLFHFVTMWKWCYLSGVLILRDICLICNKVLTWSVTSAVTSPLLQKYNICLSFVFCEAGPLFKLNYYFCFSFCEFFFLWTYSFYLKFPGTKQFTNLKDFFLLCFVFVKFRFFFFFPKWRNLQHEQLLSKICWMWINFLELFAKQLYTWQTNQNPCFEISVC